VPESRAEGAHRAFDLAGAVSVTSGLVVLVYAIVKAQEWGWGSASTLGMLGLSAALLAAFVAIERRSAAPLVRLSIFRIRTITAANVGMLLVASGMFSMFFFASIYAQEVLGFTPLEAGLAFLPTTAGIMVGAGLAQQLIRRIGVRGVAVLGLSLATAGMVILTGISADGSYVSDLLVGLLPLALGMGLTFVPITLLGTSKVGAEDAGLASGLFNTSQQVGGALGLAVLSTLAADKTASALSGGGAPTPHDQLVALVDGFQVAFTGGAILLGSAVVLLLVLLRKRDVASIEVDAVPAPAAA
jgi:predicted MFS family arabinose efflux permease